MDGFLDLHLCPTLQDNAMIEILVSKAFELGYKAVGIPFTADIQKDRILQLRKICADVNVDLVTRTDLAPKTPDELLNRLRHCRQKFEIVSITCLSKAVARQAAKDRRVDVLSFPVFGPKKLFFDHAEAELASKTGASLEIDMYVLLESRGFQRIQLLSSLRKMVAAARKFHVPIVISSGATDPYLMRQPRDFASLAFLFGMDPSDAFLSLSEKPLKMVERNREKLNPNYVIDGVRIVGRGKDLSNPKEEDI